jgi:hypothetical protein
MFPSDNRSHRHAEAMAQEGRQRYHRQKTLPSRSHEEEAWVRWEYMPEEWKLFENVDWRTHRLTFWGLAGGTAASVIAAILPWFLFSDMGQLLSVFLLALLGWCVCLPLLMMSLVSYVDARKRHQARQQGPRTVTFAGEGVWEAGVFFPLNKFLEANLKKITMTFDPPVLHFRLLRMRWGTKWKASPTTTTVRVPVPHGQEEAAGFLQERFQTEVIQERVQRQKRLKSPPEPR